ncbi:MAG: hypothetical protein KGS48_00405 [Bacteroidetes bacterium]|nr:hypothetical protein [Bacteroidota bacterium]
MKNFLLFSLVVTLLSIYACQKDSLSGLTATSDLASVTDRDSTGGPHGPGGPGGPHCDSLHNHHHPLDSLNHPPFDSLHNHHHPLDSLGHPPFDSLHHPIDTTGHGPHFPGGPHGGPKGGAGHHHGKGN